MRGLGHSCPDTLVPGAGSGRSPVPASPTSGLARRPHPVGISSRLPASVTRPLSLGRGSSGAGSRGAEPGRAGRAMTVSPRNLRALWPLAPCACTALLCLCPALRGRGAEDGAGCGPLLKGSALLLLLLGYLLLRYRGAAATKPGPRAPALAPRSRLARRSLLERFYERQLRPSPHVLGHSKAHVSRIVGELVRAAKAQGLQPGPLALALRGDFVGVGSAYEQHQVRGADAFDVLVPLRPPPRRALEPRGAGPGAFACALSGAGPEGAERGAVSSARVLRWFQGHVARCLGAVRYRLQERCRLSLAAGAGPPTLLVRPRSDYVCCHLALAVRLVPALPLGDALYLVPARQALWALDASKPEQRLLGWLRQQAPPDSCHLKCLQILKGLRDLSGRGLEGPLGSQWGRVLSSYALKTALFSVLLRGPWQAWQEQFLVERLEELVLYLRDCLHKRVLMHFFLGNPRVPEAVPVPRFLREAAPLNLLAAFDASTLDAAAAQLLKAWSQAPKIIRMYSGPRHLRRSPALCRHVPEAGQEAQSD
ncbi:inositol 1,4,5-trisphosphate receptor-interacting protein-like 2 [Alligator mississippiensis]|uniref:inositol 1,4,5-trisphosphate receptor-interacting protein-like 2 n=1 Tax=Alligator mississippiensis TaxID=8496 RepID=UPI0028778F63|nr:inositol 1,4,5-trisphosphate receptor-interacting protein-like 2 [Alligator mississippiensis]